MVLTLHDSEIYFNFSKNTSKIFSMNRFFKQYKEVHYFKSFKEKYLT